MINSKCDWTENQFLRLYIYLESSSLWSNSCSEWRTSKYVNVRIHMQIKISYFHFVSLESLEKGRNIFAITIWKNDVCKCNMRALIYIKIKYVFNVWTHTHTYKYMHWTPVNIWMKRNVLCLCSHKIYLLLKVNSIML